MKTATYLVLLLCFLSVPTFAQTEEQANNGDDFSLEGALAMFKNAKSLEEFEKAINEENNNVNNLDLNNDEKTDYVTVSDVKDGDTHVIVLSTWLSESEKQDIATIGIEKTAAEQAQLQIEGDTDLYAENTIIEPVDVEDKATGGKGGPSIAEIEIMPVVVNVWLWPSVRFLYAPAYVVWVSPYRWAAYPRWWKPWRPVSHVVFYKRVAPHRVYYRPAPVRRVAVAHRVYAPHRRSSTLVVKNRRATTVVHKNKRTGKTTAVRKSNKTGRVRAARR
ncbi:MAG: hypothetical protein EOO50_14355 [Flavobacterium sp.]|uniref:hypothetical protein n=1 Tax=Flavobacterium sp. TaxID=239 RepID=UPI00121322DA|nr:hypothetical protein [Flavobacterium sp.]RZJ65282.1 MAG: hypothetical protein EOO50_14355 [Flavobacterium sp.]